MIGIDLRTFEQKLNIIIYDKYKSPPVKNLLVYIKSFMTIIRTTKINKVLHFYTLFNISKWSKCYQLNIKLKLLIRVVPIRDNIKKIKKIN